MKNSVKGQRFKISFDRQCHATVCEAVAAHTGFSKSRVKQAMTKGAVWLKHSGNKMRRLRRATAVLRSGDQVLFYYDPDILAIHPPNADCLRDLNKYSIWFKPVPRPCPQCNAPFLVEKWDKAAEQTYVACDTCEYVEQSD